jgi:hypothetical protein
MDVANCEVEFFLIAEAGLLEQQAALLCESIRLFGGSLAGSKITVVSPRGTRRPSPTTLRGLDKLDVEYLPIEIDSRCPEYGTSFRVHAAAHIERRSGPAIVVQLDSDTLFVREPILLAKDRPAAARPVDTKGMCTTGPGDEFDPYWRDLCSVAGVDYERIPVLDTTIERLAVKASYNGGLVAARRADALFQHTEEIFDRLVAADLRPWRDRGHLVKSGAGMVSETGSAYWGTSQAALSLAAVNNGQAVDLLPSSYNYPLHLMDRASVIDLPPVHIHYHWLASDPDFSPTAMLDPRLGLPRPVRAWLLSRLPLRVAA